MTGSLPAPVIDLTFPHRWQAEILSARPLILPHRCFVYPVHAEEVERGALEILIRADGPAASQFLATCALGFSDPIVPTGIWSCPNPDQLCALSGGYAYLIDIAAPERFTMLSYRPVIEVRPLPAEGLLLFASHHALLAWGRDGLCWQSEKLSDEGVTITSTDDGRLRGLGWRLMTDRETPFTLDLRTGRPVYP